MSTGPYQSPGSYENPAPPPPRQGMSTAAKVLLSLGIIFGVLLLLCCGGLVGLSFFGQRYFKKSISEDPQVVRQTTAEIAEINLPEGLAPASSVNMKIPFTDQSLMMVAVYRDKQSDSILALVAFGQAIAEGQNRDQLRQQMREALREQGVGDHESQETRETSEKQITVRGQPETFTFVKSKDAQTGKPRLEVTGSFQGKQGPVFFHFQGDAEKYDEQQITQVLESIR